MICPKAVAANLATSCSSTTALALSRTSSATAFLLQNTCKLVHNSAPKGLNQLKPSKTRATSHYSRAVECSARLQRTIACMFCCEKWMGWGSRDTHKSCASYFLTRRARDWMAFVVACEKRAAQVSSHISNICTTCRGPGQRERANPAALAACLSCRTVDHMIHVGCVGPTWILVQLCKAPLSVSAASLQTKVLSTSTALPSAILVANSEPCKVTNCWLKDLEGAATLRQLAVCSC